MYKVKKYIKFMIKGIWHILPISSKKKVVFQYKWKMSRILRYLSRDLSTEMCQALEVQYKSIQERRDAVLYEEQARKLYRQFKKIHRTGFRLDKPFA